MPHQRARWFAMTDFLILFLNKIIYFIKKTPPDGVVDSMIFEIENHRIPSHYDLHIKNFNSDELKFLIEYQYNSPVSAFLSVHKLLTFSASLYDIILLSMPKYTSTHCFV